MQLSPVVGEWSGQTPLMVCLMTKSGNVSQTNSYLQRTDS